MNKQIEEMAKVIDKLLVEKPKTITEHALNLATWLFDNKYRRQDEVVRDIFTKLEEEIKPLLEKNYRLYTKYLNEQDSQTVLRFGGKIDALRGIYCFIEELKKKYGVTES